MRPAALLMILLWLLISCDQSDTKFVRSQDVVQAGKTEREILIEELKRLQAVIASKDKEKIADLFSFPVSYESVGIYIADSTYNAPYEQDGNKASRSMFLDHVDEISESLQMSELNRLFQELKVESLLQMDSYQALADPID